MSAAAGRDWDAATYHRVSEPHVQWARRVLDRLPLRGDERVLDAGCGSGRVTELIVERVPRGRVVAVDQAPSMVAAARELLGERAEVRQADLATLSLPEPVDAAFSNAVFHWVADHDGLFAALRRTLRPGGRLIAQCGGEGNVARFHRCAAQVAARDPYAAHLGGWEGPWNFQGAQATAARLEAAGFTDVDCWLEPWPVTPPDPPAFLRSVCLGYHLARLPEQLREPYIADVLAALGDPVQLDYVRLNIAARRPGA